MKDLYSKYRSEIYLALIAVIYLAINMVFTYNQFYLLNLLPAAILIAYLAFTRLDIIYFALIAFTPLSIPLIEFVSDSPIDFYIPTEPMLFGVMLIIIYRSVQKSFLDKKIFNHPVSLAIAFNIFWIFFTSITSSMPLVSFKFLLARIWFITSFYLLAIYIFKDVKSIKKMIWAYTIPLLIVIVYTWNRHFTFGLNDREAAHFVMNPFFRDHTSYGAALAMIIFPFIAINLIRGRSFLRKSVIFTIGLILFLALVLSYTRAAWISIFISLAVLIIVLLKIKFKYLAIISVLALFLLYSNQEYVLKKFERNDKESSENLTEHLQSVTNIATDISNLERFNRWASAFRMFKERPILGWGPGTYMFQYAPFQKSSQRTPISTNFGTVGNAHSEYIGPLSESGVLGPLSLLIIVITSLITAFKVYHRMQDEMLKRLVLSLILGFITYLFHGIWNNFLDTDKASSLFWGYIAVFVSLDLYYREEGIREIKS